MKRKEGFVHIYTGDGKGKTTAAIGLTVRALGAGLKVVFVQFFKPGDSSEVKVLKELPNLRYFSFGKKGFRKGDIPEEEKNLILSGWAKVKEFLKSENLDVLVLDEFTYCVNWGIIPLQEVVKALKDRTLSLEVVITGRKAPEELLELADLVTFMKKVKHYFDENTPARKGIEK